MISPYAIYDELGRRAPRLQMALSMLDRYEADCRLCVELGLEQPKTTDLIWQFEERIIAAMRERDWHE